MCIHSMKRTQKSTFHKPSLDKRFLFLSSFSQIMLPKSYTTDWIQFIHKARRLCPMTIGGRVLMAGTVSSRLNPSCKVWGDDGAQPITALCACLMVKQHHIYSIFKISTVSYFVLAQTGGHRQLVWHLTSTLCVCRSSITQSHCCVSVLRCFYLGSVYPSRRSDWRLSKTWTWWTWCNYNCQWTNSSDRAHSDTPLGEWQR
jgi:hypothetical protein